MSKLPSHHYIPQGYLKQFINDGMLYVLNKQYGSIRPTSPAGVAYVPGFYIVDTLSEKDSSEVEEAFSKIETICIPIIKMMVTGEYLTNVNIADLAIYIALQYGRTPFSRARMDDVSAIVMTNLVKEQLARAYNDLEKYNEMAKYLQASNPDLDMPSREKIKEWIMSPGPIAPVLVDNGSYVKQLFENAGSIAAELLSRRWIVLRAPKKTSFITSDNPIGLYLRRPLIGCEVLAILKKDIQRFFPLNSKTCLVIIDNDKFELLTDNITKDQVKAINRLIFDQAYKYVISGSSQLLLSLYGQHNK